MNSTAAYLAFMENLHDEYSVRGEVGVRPLRRPFRGECDECGRTRRLSFALLCEREEGGWERVGALCDECAEGYDEV